LATPRGNIKAGLPLGWRCGGLAGQVLILQPLSCPPHGVKKEWRSGEVGGGCASFVPPGCVWHRGTRVPRRENVARGQSSRGTLATGMRSRLVSHCSARLEVHALAGRLP
jgi:hypothetical protein